MAMSGYIQLALLVVVLTVSTRETSAIKQRSTHWTNWRCAAYGRESRSRTAPKPGPFCPSGKHICYHIVTQTRPSRNPACNGKTTTQKTTTKTTTSAAKPTTTTTATLSSTTTTPAAVTAAPTTTVAALGPAPTTVCPRFIETDGAESNARYYGGGGSIAVPLPSGYTVADCLSWCWNNLDCAAIDVHNSDSTCCYVPSGIYGAVSGYHRPSTDFNFYFCNRAKCS